MSSVSVVTYATKSSGLFEELVRNPFGVPVTVLGWGTRWNGFTDKFKAMVEYLDSKRPDDVVVFLDGFDTVVNRDPVDLLDRFRSYGCDVLVSDSGNGGPVGSYITHRVFGVCDSGYTANSGMYMGYAKALGEVLRDTLARGCQDDQVNLNAVCSKHDVTVDHKKLVFHNVFMTRLGTSVDSDAIFVSFPGSLNFSRWYRAMTEYAQFFRVHCVVLCLALAAVAPRRYRVAPLALLGASVVFYVVAADTSCV